MFTNQLNFKLLVPILSLWVSACGGGQSAVASINPIDVPQAVTSEQKQRVGIGISGLSYWDRSFSMADVARQAQVRGMDWSSNLAVDSDGNPLKDFQLIYSAPKIGAGTYKLSFSGRATLSTGGAGSIQNTSYDAMNNMTKAEVVLTNPATGNVWLIFKDTYRNFASDKGDGVSNIKLWRPGYATDGSVLFTTEFLEAMKKFRVLRGMDFVSANSNSQSSWQDRTKPSFFGLTGNRGQSWELLIALANATDRDVWLNVPVKADSDYIRKLAQLVKYGSDGDQPYTSIQAKPTYPPLKQGLKVYVEYGNEIWNAGAGFFGFGWALALSNTSRGDTNHPIAFDRAETNQYTALKRWIAYRSATISLTFRDVFGDSEMMTTVRPILASQVGNRNQYLSAGLQWAQAFYGEVRQTEPRNPIARKPSDIWYGGGGAAYYGGSIDPKDINAATMDMYFASLPTEAFARDSIIDSIWTHAYGLKYVAYEGGPGPGGSALGSTADAAISPNFNNDPRMKDRMLIAQEIWDRAGGDELVYYVYSGSSPWSFSNDLVQQVVSDTSSIKLQAIDAINAKPKPDVTLGSTVPGVINLKTPASQVIGSDAAPWALGGTVYLLRPTGATPYLLVPIRAASPGNYKVSLNVSSKVTGSVALFVNGATSGLIKLAPDINNTVTVSSKVSVALPAGLSVLRLDTPQGSGDIFVKDLVVE